MNYFVIQCYGKERILREAKFCVLSLLKFIKSDSGYTIILYTDNAPYFSDISQYVVCEPMTPEMVQEWKGEHNFIHRVKVKMLMQFAQKYEGKFIYLDSDTWFKSHPQPLFDLIDDSNALLHLPEAQLKSNANPIIKKIHRFVEGKEFAINGGEKVSIPAEYYMWNAGVIGLQTPVMPLLERVLQLTDAMLAQYQKHVMEQLAFSYFLQKTERNVSTNILFIDNDFGADNSWYLHSFKWSIYLDCFFTSNFYNSFASIVNLFLL